MSRSFEDRGGRSPLIIKDLDLYPQPPLNTRSPTLNSEEPPIPRKRRFGIFVSAEVTGGYLPRSTGVEAPNSIHIEVQGQSIRAEDRDADQSGGTEGEEVLEQILTARQASTNDDPHVGEGDREVLLGHEVLPIVNVSRGRSPVPR